MSDHSTGGCYCGRVRFRFNGKAESTVHCHCGECRRLSGGAFTTWVNVPREAFHIEDAAELQAFGATANVVRRFCRHCGTHVCTDDRRQPGVVGIPAGVLDDSSVVDPRAHYFVSDAAPWHRIDDGLPCFGGPSGYEPLRTHRAGKMS